MSNDRELIRGKVARILTARQLALNIGVKDGVKVGMLFDVLDPKGDDITDPDTGEVLGSLYRPKVRVEIIEAQERLSVAQTFKKYKVNIGGSGFDLGSSIADILKPPKYVTRYETLKTTEKTWESIEEGESYVKSGDPVVEVREESQPLLEKETEPG